MSMEKYRRLTIITLFAVATAITSCVKDAPPDPPAAPAVALSVTSISPTRGIPGTMITIVGSGFSSILTENIVYIRGVMATVISATSTELIVVAPVTSSGAVTIVVKEKE